MSTVTSKDGTKIAYDKQGSGPAVILVDGALCYRGFGPMPDLAKLLTPHFTVYTYDRRGRGESGNNLPFSVEREVEDLDALINEAGGSACLCGLSSGGALSLEAAIRLGSKVKKLAIYEAPYNSDVNSRGEWKEYLTNLQKFIDENKPGDAVTLFMTFVGTPAEMVGGMRQSPMWPMFEAVVPTLIYDATVLGQDRTVPVERAASIKSPALLMNGGAGLLFMKDTADRLAKAIPNAQRRILEGQRHDVSREALAPELIEFFKSETVSEHDIHQQASRA